MVKEFACNAGDPGSIPGLGRFPWRRKWQPTLVPLLGKSHGQRSLVGYSPWGCKDSDTTERLSDFTFCSITWSILSSRRYSSTFLISSLFSFLFVIFNGIMTYIFHFSHLSHWLHYLNTFFVQI